MTQKANYETESPASLKNALQREFIRRCKKNPSYSLRAYAQYLEVDQSFLSKLLNGRRQVTLAMAEKLSGKIGLSPTKTASFRARSTQDDFVPLLEDEYETISSWLHFAILELIKTKTFKPSYTKVAQLFGVHSQEVKDAVDRLVRLGFLKISDKKWTLISKNHTWSNYLATTDGRRKLQIELNRKSAEALENTPFPLRENASLTIAIDSRRLPEFKEKLNKTLRDLSDHFQPDQKNLDAVYQITLALFPLSKNINQEKIDEKN